MEKGWPDLELEMLELVPRIPKAVAEGEYGVAARLCHEYLSLYMALLDIVLIDHVKECKR